MDWKNESAKYWTTAFNGLKNRGIEGIFILTGKNATLPFGPPGQE